MHAIIWFVLLFAVAVVAATTLGTNDGLVTFYWGGWRLDLSLNLFVLLLIGTCFVLVTVIQAVNGLLGLPQRAHEWRVSRRDRSAQGGVGGHFRAEFPAEPDDVGEGYCAHDGHEPGGDPVELYE